MKKNYLSLIVALLLAQYSFAHWTTKGPYGGKVKCMIVCDTNIIIGTANGGVYRSNNQQFLAWRYINYTGLTNPQTMALASIGQKILAGTSAGIFRSKDAGVTWSAMNSGLSTTNILSLVTMGSNVFAGTNGGGVFMSSDSGATWSPVSSGLTNQIVAALAVDGGTLYAGTNGGGVFRSINNGASWNAVIAGLTNMSINTLLVSGATMLAGTNTGVFTTPTSVISWSQSNSGLGNTTINNFCVNSGTLFVATNGGVFTSSNSGISWTNTSTSFTDSVSAVLVYNGKLFAGTPNRGLYKSSSVSGPSWGVLNSGFNNLGTYTCYNDNQLVIAATEKGLFVSRDLANTYVPSNKGLSDSLHVTCLAFAGTKLYAGTLNGGVFMSADTGRNWSAANSGMGIISIRRLCASNTHIFAAGANGAVYSSLQSVLSWSLTTGLPGGLFFINALASDGVNTFLGSMGNGVYTTTNNTSWTAQNTGLSNLNVTSLAVKGTNVYAGTNGGGIFKSSVTSVTWAAANTGLPTMSITVLASAGVWVVAGYKGGVHSTFDDGASWAPTNVEMYIPAFADVITISFSNASTRVFIATPNNSLYSNGTSELAVGIEELSMHESNFVISPNPGNGDFTVRLKSENDRLKNMSIYDINGRLLDVYPAQEQLNNPVLHLGYPSGIYFLKVVTEKGSGTQKIVIQ